MADPIFLFQDIIIILHLNNSIATANDNLYAAETTYSVLQREKQELRKEVHICPKGLVSEMSRLQKPRADNS